METENNTRQRRTVSTGTWLAVLLVLVIFIVFPNAFMIGFTYMLVFAWTILAFFIAICL